MFGIDKTCIHVKRTLLNKNFQNVARTVVRKLNGIERQEFVFVKTNMAEIVVFTVPSTCLYMVT